MGRRKLKLAFSTLMQQIKARSSRHVQIEFPELRKRYWGTLFWARGFFSTTSGNVTDDVILQYLELYSKRETICISVNGGVKFGHCGGAKVGQFGASALERAALI